MPPAVSVIVPCYNEARTIRELLDSIEAQTFDLANLEVLISDGGSTDGTREVVSDITAATPQLRITLVDNPDRSIPAALNRALAAASGGVVIRLDAHAVPASDYIARCVQVLAETEAANVGGVWDIRPGAEGWVARSIAAAVAHRLGAGDAGYRAGARAGEVDTVPFGAFDRRWLDRVGTFNEDLLTNEDYEYNYRIRKAGGKIWLDPSIRCVYIARPTLSALAKQYWRYGFWKAHMLTLHPHSLRLRQAIPPAFVAALLGLLVVAPFLPAAAAGLIGLAGIYLAVVLGAALFRSARRRDISLMIGLPAAWASVHLCWGMGFLAGLASALMTRRRHA
ncbi:MAG: glycosyltransferase family 2 protein [Anaerolineales bacterium]|nr:glycosyltransferase family 2 protein [Anaerolineales bacterium]